jgi:hypothetical protein
MGIVKATAEGLQHSSTTVISRASANADNESAASSVQRRLDQLPDTICSCQQWISFGNRNKRQTRGGRYFEDSRIPVSNQPVERIDLAPQRTDDRLIAPRTLGGRHHSFNCTLATICNGHEDIFRVRIDLSETLPDFSRDIESGEALLVRIGSDDNLQRLASVSSVRPTAH